jgi:hypothetical protein
MNLLLLALAALLGSSAAQAPSARGSSVVSNVALLAEGDRRTRVLTLRDMGSFRVACPGGRLSVAFTAQRASTVDLVVAEAGAAPRGAAVDPGHSFRVGPAATDAAFETWQLSRYVKNQVHVASVTFASSLIGDPDVRSCAVSVEAVIQQRPRQNAVGVTG